MAGPFKILSLDGGGIRGVIPAVVLTALETRLKRPVAQAFDLIAGTSTGGILALGLTKPGADGTPAFSAEELVELYAEHGREIFSRSVWHRARAFGNAVEEKYPAEDLEHVLEHYFADAKLSAATTDVLVTAYEIESRTPWFFSSHAARENREKYDFPMKKVARATSAAPTYFEPLKLETEGVPDYWALIDGGVFANNPAMCAVAEAFNTYGADELLVVSIGTGAQTRRIAYDEAAGWGLVGWARPILDVVFDGVSDTVDYQVQQICRSTEEVQRYFRFQTPLDIGNDDMDDASATNIHALKLQAERLTQERRDDLDKLAAKLV
jgi:patatin-like phospholipase/acyl hydrolase